MSNRTEVYDGSGNLISVEDSRTLEQAIREKHTAINDFRESLITSGVFYMGHVFDSDERSRANVTAVAAAISNGIPMMPGFGWRTANNVGVPMTTQQFMGLAAALLARTNQIYGASWYHKDTISNLTTIEAVDAYNFSYGWPS